MLSEVIELSEDDLVKICQSFYGSKFSKNENIEVKSYKTNSLSEVPCGFLAHHDILTVTFECEGGEHTTDFFVKTINKNLKKYIEESGVFKKEIGIYQEIIPKLKTLASIKWAPECYLINKENQIVVFENLRNSEFEMVANNNGIFDVHHIFVAVPVLAAFHASSIIYEMNAGELKNWVDLLEENVYPSDPKTVKNVTYKYTVDTLSELLKRIPKYKDNIKEILPIFRQIMLKMFEFVKPSNKYRNVISHGDLWTNNFLFKYAVSINGINNKNNRIPVEAILIDFQLSRYAPPALDLMAMLTINSNSFFRKQYFQQLCDVYNNHLALELKNHSIDIDLKISRNEFDESCTFYREAALIESCSFSTMTLLPENLLSSVMSDPIKCNNFMTKPKTEICLEAFQTDDNYRSRMSDMLIELVDEFVLK